MCVSDQINSKDWRGLSGLWGCEQPSRDGRKMEDEEGESGKVGPEFSGMGDGILFIYKTFYSYFKGLHS